MKKLGILTATLILAACSHSKKQPTMPEEAMSNEPSAGMSGDTSGSAATDPTEEPATSANDDDDTSTAMQKGAGTGTATGTMGAGAGMGSASGSASGSSTSGASLGAGTGSAAQDDSASGQPAAEAHLVSIKDGSAMGVITFEQQGSTINMSGTFNNLPPGPHAFYIHTVGDCSKKGAKVGAHLNPTKAKHGPPGSSVRHAGDLGDITADADGNATFSMSTDSVVMEDGRPDSILDRAIVIHAKKDDKKGSGGAPIACGVIEKEGGAGDESRQTAVTPAK